MAIAPTYNGYEPTEVLTAEQIEEGWGVSKTGKPVHPQRFKNLGKPFSGSDDPRHKKAMEVNRRKQEIREDRKRLEEELRDFKRDSISSAKERVESGELGDAIQMLQDSLIEIDYLIARTEDEKIRNHLMDTKIKYINSYANLTLGGVSSTSLQEDEIKEQVTQEDLDKKFAEFTGKFDVIDGGKKDVG